MSILAQFSSANRFVQSFIGETATIGGTNYSFSQGEQFTTDFDYEAGGAVKTFRGSIIVNKSDLASEPTRGTTVTFPSGTGSRSFSYRVTDVDDKPFASVWEIHLLQLND